MAPRIRICERAENGELSREISVTRDEFVIGRGADCDLRLADDDVSRHHCSIHSSGADPLLLDLGSANGSFLNGQRIRSQSVIKSRDVITVGGHTFVVLFDDDDLSRPGLPEVNPNLVTRRLPKTK
jgi:pSer/pThr/pTyr-binding forkhead associated (FHA) protein